MAITQTRHSSQALNGWGFSQIVCDASEANLTLATLVAETGVVASSYLTAGEVTRLSALALDILADVPTGAERQAAANLLLPRLLTARTLDTTAVTVATGGAGATITLTATPAPVPVSWRISLSVPPETAPWFL